MVNVTSLEPELAAAVANNISNQAKNKEDNQAGQTKSEFPGIPGSPKHVGYQILGIGWGHVTFFFFFFLTASLS